MLARVSRWGLPPLIVILGLVAFRLATGSIPPKPELPLRDLPWTIGPRYDEPRVVTDAQLYAVLERLKPPAGEPDTNQRIHALRLWGPKAEFADPARPSGAQLAAYFLDDRAFQAQTGPDVPPLWITTDLGIQARAWDAHDRNAGTSAHHTDDLLATFGEMGAPSDTRLVMRERTATVGQAVRDALGRFHLIQDEYEWSIISYARYAFPLKNWHNDFGQRIQLGDLIDELIEHPLQLGPCGGTHRLEAMVVLYRADEQAHALSRVQRQKVLAHMRHISALLEAGQTAEGFWSRRWPLGAAARQDTDAPISDRILLTSHHLEWLALAPPEVQPPQETVIRAAQWLVRAIAEVDEKDLLVRYGPFSHAARALCLWRSQDPYEAWRAGRAAATSSPPAESAVD